LISKAEEAVIGTRHFQVKPSSGVVSSEKYELHGVVDVLTEVELRASNAENSIIKILSDTLKIDEGIFEVIVDYKGARRPSVKDEYWEQHDWQLQTYAWLRMQQEKTREVKAGALIYINELLPGVEDIEVLKEQLAKGTADITPVRGTKDYYLLSAWRRGDPVPELSAEFRLRRALRVVPIDEATQRHALEKFDATVVEIEAAAAREIESGSLKSAWIANGKQDSCETCDFVTFCSNPFGKNRDKPTFPSVP
jgi:CRISPR/Cas system-associated exonuclease Cas4 (RecB family)